MSSAAPSVTPPFLTKLYGLVDDPATAGLVSWIPLDDPAAHSFTVHKPSDFARDVLPRHFKHNNFSSFVRQLNQYGFHKQDPDRWTFAHDSFRRGRMDLLSEISRRRPKTQQPVAATPSGVAPGGAGPSRLIPNDLNSGGGVASQKAVVELGNYGGLGGVFGELDSLKRDKDLLVRELVVTRNAETKLKSKCDTLEQRVDSLERNSKQMQSFILHYFSQVLQPYNAPMASRKRKRLPSNIPAEHADPGSDGNTGTSRQNLAIAPPPSGQSVEMLLAMLQQMQLPASDAEGGSTPGGPTPSTLYATSGPGDVLPKAYPPVLVQEIAHDDPAHSSSPSSSVKPASPQLPAFENEFVSHTARAGKGVPAAMNGASIPNTNGAGSLPPQSVSPAGLTDVASNATGLASLSLSGATDGKGENDVLPAAQASFVLKQEEEMPSSSLPAFSVQTQSDAFLLDASSLREPLLGASGPVTVPNLAPSESTGKMIDDMLDMDMNKGVFPPLTELPQGTDIASLARQVEEFAGVESDGLDG